MYIHVRMHTQRPTYAYTHMHVQYIHKKTHTHIHTYLHHTYIHIGMHTGHSFHAIREAGVVDADGEIVSHYRKSHIPDGPGYQEKFYFAPGDTGFVISETQFGTLGVGICWDQWFPEVARSLVLQGAEMLLYPTAIGSEPVSGLDSRAHWRRTMQGHAAANMVPLVASNRIGEECGETCKLSFYGSSFIADQTGAILVQAGDDEEALLIQEFDLTSIRKQRIGWGLFRDRRPDLYQSILTLSGEETAS